jgi:hypothetical protein
MSKTKAGNSRAPGSGLALAGKLLGLGVLALAGVGFGAADARADAVQMWNAEMLSIIRQTSPLIVDGPPEVAREIAILGTAMSDAARATTSGAWLPYAYTGGAASGASTEAAVLAAGYQSLTSIFSNSIWANTTMVGAQTAGSAAVQTNVLNQISNAYSTALSSLGGSQAVTDGVAAGIAAANAVTAKRANDGAIAAITAGIFGNMGTNSGVPAV